MAGEFGILIPTESGKPEFLKPQQQVWHVRAHSPGCASLIAKGWRVGKLNLLATRVDDDGATQFNGIVCSNLHSSSYILGHLVIERAPCACVCNQYSRMSFVTFVRMFVGTVKLLVT